MPRRFVCLLALTFMFAIYMTAQTDDQNATASASQDQSAASTQIPSVAVPTVPVPTDTQRQNFHQSVQDIHFDFDRSNIRPQDRQILQSDAQWLQAHPDVFVTIEGNADERGEIVYNLFLSDLRAQATHDALLQMGVPEKQILFATGWGKLYPVCTESDESCWEQNRRSHFALWGVENGSGSAGAASH